MNKAALAHMEDFLENLRLVLPALRFDFLTEQLPTTTIAEPVLTDSSFVFLRWKFLDLVFELEHALSNIRENLLLKRVQSPEANGSALLALTRVMLDCIKS